MGEAEVDLFFEEVEAFDLDAQLVSNCDSALGTAAFESESAWVE